MTTTTKRLSLWGFEVRSDGRWSEEAAGQQDASNCFATREEAEAGVAALAEALECPVADVRVALLDVASS